MGKRTTWMVLAAALVVFVAGQAQAVDVLNMGGTRDSLTGTWTGAASLEMVPVGNAGNAADDTGYGAVDHAYNIGKYEVTAGQYTEFLNAKALQNNNKYGLFSNGMSDPVYGCGITYNGSARVYTVAANYINHPVNYVNFWDAARFANWLHNGQGNGDTETGAYTLNGYSGFFGFTIAKNAGAQWWIPSEDEWYKAAYHKNNGTAGGTGNYFDYPNGSDNLPTTAQVNIYTTVFPYKPAPYTTDVGAFSASPSPYGTFDQGGNLWEWNDSIIGVYDAASYRGYRGGTFSANESYLASSYRYVEANPVGETSTSGFRVASVPEPGSISLLVAGVIAGLVWWRRLPQEEKRR